MKKIKKILQKIKNVKKSKKIKIVFFVFLTVTPLVEKHLLNPKSTQVEFLREMKSEEVVARLQLEQNIMKIIENFSNNYVDPVSLTKTPRPKEEEIERALYQYKHLALPSAEQIESLAFELKKYNQKILERLKWDFGGDFKSIGDRLDNESELFQKKYFKNNKNYVEAIDQDIRKDQKWIDDRLIYGANAKKKWEEEFGSYDDSVEIEWIGKVRENMEAAKKYRIFIETRLPIISRDIVLSRLLHAFIEEKLKESGSVWISTFYYLTSFAGLVGAIVSFRKEE